MTDRDDASLFAATAAERDPGENQRTPEENHHLWRNGRLWWVAFTFYVGERRYRMRRSLGTADVGQARARRDALLARCASTRGWRLALGIAQSGLAGASGSFSTTKQSA